MDTFIVSARKYRPSTFKSVVGQEALTTTLKNAIAGNKLAHAYLFSGPRGVGKTTCARIFAKTINCLDLTPENEACNKCESCVAFNEQRSYNIHELDAASNNGVDDIRSLIDQVRIPPQIGKYKVYIIDEVHMLSQSAFNSFLKTLEEPPAHAIFILATTEKHKIIPTILSRCQVYDFNRIKIADIVEHLQYVALQENVITEPEALNVIAQKADGGMRDALSIFDQTASYTQGNITYKAVIENLNVLDYEYYFKLTDAILDGNVVDCLLILNDILNRGFEGQYIISGVASHFRDLLVCKDEKTASLFEVGASIREQYIETAKRCSNDFLYKAIEIANECDLNYRISKNRRLLLELTLIKLCQLQESPVKKEENKSSLKPIEKATTDSKTVSTENRNTNSESKAQSEKPQSVKPQSDTTSSARTKEVPKPDVTSKTSSQQSKKSALKSMGISLTSLSSMKEEKTNENEDERAINGNNTFTEKQLKAAWDEYAGDLKGEPLLKNTMSLYKPKLISEVIFEVEVNTEINKEYLMSNSMPILTFLRSKVKNDDLTMTIKIAEGNAITKPLTSREIFDEMADKNPALQKLSDEFGLELN
ncbi:MAG: DNA polymerase III subunit gamma/tau [Fermentimonas sp.]|nr:DNA polymerase III subunit gamma/tau [Fermentimonas sp.]